MGWGKNKEEKAWACGGGREKGTTEKKCHLRGILKCESKLYQLEEHGGLHSRPWRNRVNCPET